MKNELWVMIISLHGRDSSIHCSRRKQEENRKQRVLQKGGFQMWKKSSTLQQKFIICVSTLTHMKIEAAEEIVEDF